MTSTGVLSLSCAALLAAACSSTSGATTGADGSTVVTGTGGTGALDTTNSVLTRNKHETRDAFFIQPTLTKAKAALMAPDTTFNASATFMGAMWASPLYVENGPGGKGVYIAAATNNNVYAIDETTGKNVWTGNIGSAPLRSYMNGCGSIHPIGIISTPVVDATKRVVYTAGAIGPTTGYIQRHEIHALDLDTGKERAGWPVNVSALKDPNGVAFNSGPQNQRSALSLVGGILYVAYGGHVGDCGQYHGWVIAVDTTDPTKTGAWATAGSGEAIWASGGMASDGTGVFAITGNRTSDSATHQDSEEVVHLTAMAQLNRTTGVYFPADWRLMDSNDYDFGSSSPVVFSVAGSTPSTLVGAASKDGHFYLLNPANLGGMAGHIQDLVVAPAGMNIRATLASYVSSTGVHVVFNVSGNSSCGKGVVSVGVTPGRPPIAKQSWCAITSGDSSPIATSTDGRNETIVWYMNGNQLNAVDGDTGMPLFSGGTCSGVEEWTSPIAVKGHIVAGGDGHLCSWSAPP